MRNRLSPGRWEACGGIWPERVWTRSKSCFKLQKLEADLTFSGYRSNLRGLPSTRSGWSGGLLLGSAMPVQMGYLIEKQTRMLIKIQTSYRDVLGLFWHPCWVY